MTAPSAPASHWLTRDVLLSGVLPDMIRQSNPDAHVLTDAEREHSLHETLLRRPDHGGGVWVFAYGSLIWNPMIHFTRRDLGQVVGWHRRFCLATKSGRGTPDNPGLVLGLRPGGVCTGAAFHIDEPLVEAELDLLWRREMVADGYIPSWVELRAPCGGPAGHALTFVVNPDGPGYVDLDEQETVARLATASGRLGSSAEYLFNTRDGLRELGMIDPHLDHLADQVTALMQVQA